MNNAIKTQKPFYYLMTDFDYIISQWTLNSDGSSHVALSLYKTWDGALEQYNVIKLQIQNESTRMQHNVVNISSIDDESNYSDNIDEYLIYVVNKNYDDEIAYYQDFGWKRPRGVALKKVKRNDSVDQVWTTDVSCYPTQHGGQW